MDAVVLVFVGVSAACSLVAAAVALLGQKRVASLEEGQRQDRVLNKTHFDAVNSAVAAADQRLESKIDASRRETANALQQNTYTAEVKLDRIRDAVDSKLEKIREDNSRQLTEMRATVDEKLSRTLNDSLARSFSQVNEQLEAVYKGLGEMQAVAQDVGGLKRVLSNVKTRGILGEVQLAAILGDILTADQYDQNVATKPGSSDRVEFAVKIPVEDGTIYLPIDAKFPGDAYDQLRDAQESGEKDAVEAARKVLESRIKGEAKDICEKYISVPQTTNFAIMFLPFEGLYAEVVDRPGLLECLQRDYHVNVAGPSTMAALLNSLQMSYQTLALQRRADEIAQVLAAVKAEFPRYQAELERALKQLDTARGTVSNIITTRTNVIERKLKDVTALEDPQEAERLLGLGDLGGTED